MLRKTMLALSALSFCGMAQVNKVANFSFEASGSTGSLAANWSPGWGGYQRVFTPIGQNWDGSYALRLAGPSGTLLGAVQRINFNQSSHIPILITMQIKGESIANVSGDNLGASFDCRVKFTGLSEFQLSYCPTTAKTKNVGTFNWRYVGVNTTDLVNGHLPIEWIELRLRRGAVSGTAYFDDIQVKEYPQGSFGGAVTLMFDDCYKEHRTYAVSALGSFGWKGTEAVVTNYLGSGDPQYCNLSDVLSLRNAGWEIVSHSLNHPDLTLLSPTAMEDQLYWSKRYLTDRGIAVKSFALPFGAYNAFVLGTNEERGYYSSMRTSDSGYNPMGTFPHHTKVQKVESGTSFGQVSTWLSEARTRRAWVVLLFHKIRPSCPDKFCVTEQMFQTILTSIHSSSLPVVTYEQGLTLVKSPR